MRAECDYLVLGSGVAGLSFALEAARHGRVTMVTKRSRTDSATNWAQGGIAAVLDPTDSFEAHVEDTLNTGGGLSRRNIVEMVVRDGPSRIQELIELGARFSRRDESESLDLTREGGHSARRVVHAGDITGEEVQRVLVEAAAASPSIEIYEDYMAIDLVQTKTPAGSSRVVGAYVLHETTGNVETFPAKETILATGGAGKVYLYTSNPDVATGDGVAMAYRAGAVLGDLEFMQFHPTTLYIAGAERTLITEALRGAGGLLVDSSGERFMPDYHEMAELAPRDVVSRAIYDRMAKTHATNVFLDVRHLGSKYLAEHFPTITALCESFDIDVDTNMIPVRPSAHYMVGGVKTDIEGRTSIKNLYCCGEAATTGLHGSNRLASNSLLEGLVFGKVIGDAIARENHSDTTEPHRHIITYDIADSQRSRLDIPDVTNSLRSIMWRNVGLERSGQRLEETVEIIDFWRRYVMDKVFDRPVEWQCQNMLTVSRLIARSALLRRESRGVHFRNDYDKRDDKNFSHHIYTSIDSDDITSD